MLKVYYSPTNYPSVQDGHAIPTAKFLLSKAVKENGTYYTSSIIVVKAMYQMLMSDFRLQGYVKFNANGDDVYFTYNSQLPVDRSTLNVLTNEGVGVK